MIIWVTWFPSEKFDFPSKLWLSEWVFLFFLKVKNKLSERSEWGYIFWPEGRTNTNEDMTTYEENQISNEEKLRRWSTNEDNYFSHYYRRSNFIFENPRRKKKHTVRYSTTRKFKGHRISNSEIQNSDFPSLRFDDLWIS